MVAVHGHHHGTYRACVLHWVCTEREAGGWLRCTWVLHVACADAECAVAVLWMHVLVHGMWWVGVGGGLVLAGCICALGWGITCVDHHGWQWMHTGKC